MASEIVANVNQEETRVALLENGIVTELHIEREHDRGIVGNIYKGVVSKVLPGMQVAFVDIGLEKAGFLYVGDIDRANSFDFRKIIEQEETDTSTQHHGLQPVSEAEEYSSGQPAEDSDVSIADILKEGQELLIQIAKNPLGTKGARLTSYITLPGRYVVFMPGIDHVGVSRRIEEEMERARLKSIVSELKKPREGYIVRTAAENAQREEIAADMEFLRKLWYKIHEAGQQAPAPSLVYHELNLLQRSMRDLFGRDVASMVIDSFAEYENCRKFAETYLPGVLNKIEFYGDREPLFDSYGIELEIERSLGRKIWLKSGGYIVIDQTEALTAIDVNTGKYVGKRTQEETILKTNLEAVKEIVYQLRLRNIGGLIVLDFIDMEKEESKEKVYNALEQALRHDRSRSKILKVSDLGLVEMTRKRTTESLIRVLCEPCPYCEGKGTIKSERTICFEILREIKRIAASRPDQTDILVDSAPKIADTLLEDMSHMIDSLEEELKIKITIQSNKNNHQEEYDVQ